MPYVDTSVVVAALTNEVETARMQAWLGDRKAGDLAISAWVATEFSAALSVKLRRGDLSEEHRDAALAEFRRLATRSFLTIPIVQRQFETAARFAGRSPLGLRAGDALHLAIAAEAGIALATLDRGQAEAGTALGLATYLL